MRADRPKAAIAPHDLIEPTNNLGVEQMKVLELTRTREMLGRARTPGDILLVAAQLLDRLCEREPDLVAKATATPPR